VILFLKIGSIFLALILFLRLKINLSLSILLLSLYTVILFQVNANTAIKTAGQSLIADRTLRLMVIIVMVLFIAAVLKSRKMFDKLIASLNTVVKDTRVVAMIAPAIVGFLPMPGGALVSAPLVDVSTKKMNLKPAFSTFLNYWFRHVWEFVWPVYAGLLIFQEYSRIPLKKIILFQSPFTLLNIITGLIVVFVYFKKHRIRRGLPEYTTTFSRTTKDFFEGVWPIFLVILLFFILSIPLYLSLILVALIVILAKQVKPKEIIHILFSKTIIKTVILIGTVMIFQQIIEISRAFNTLSTMDVPKSMIVLFCFLVSFSMGFFTGVNTSFIIISYPILRPLLQTLPDINFFYMSLYVYVIGFAGILASPVHLCLVLTNEYFKSSLVKVYRYLALPVIVLVIVSTTLVLVL
jgi:integral membrane protein (TIGR00529 family)